MNTVLSAPETFPFLVALGLVLGLFVLEGVSLLLGGSFGSLGDSVLPEVDLDLDADVGGDVHLEAPSADGAHLDLDHGPHAEVHHGSHVGHEPGADTAHHGSAKHHALAWMRVGQVPVMALLVIFLGSFGFLGIAVQVLAEGLLGGLLPAWAASAVAFVGSIPVVRVTGGWVARLAPKDETTAVSSDSFVGSSARVVLGTARPGSPAQAKLVDRHGQTHYVLVEPEAGPEGEQSSFETGSSVILVERRGAVFRAVPNPYADAAEGFSRSVAATGLDIGR